VRFVDTNQAMPPSPVAIARALDGCADATAAATATVAHVGATDRFLGAVYLARGGRLRCVAAHDAWPIRDGLAPTAGVVGRTFRTATETIARGAVAFADDAAVAPGVVAEACFPLLVDGQPVGVLDVASRTRLRGEDVERLRGYAIALAAQLGQLGVPAEPPARRLMRHATAIATLHDGDAIARAVLSAAVDIAPADSATLVRLGAGGTLRPIAASGPLAEALRAAPHEQLAAWLSGGGSCLAPGHAGAAVPEPLAALRAAGAHAIVAVGLVDQGELVGHLVAASTVPTTLTTGDVELLEHLGAHAAGCLRTADLLRDLRDRAASDPLTGLGHHATFHEALAGSHRRPNTAVVLCDIDGFKDLNDTYGHAHGDRVLCGLADAMSSALRRGDELFRIGGDEFAALMAVESEAEAVDAAARLRDAVTAARLGVSVSIGVAVPRSNESDAEVLARADRALYRVKATGRDGVVLANDEPLPVTPVIG
jgi:diguanylate cyclase (GGDEF)-like protein